MIIGICVLTNTVGNISGYIEFIQKEKDNVVIKVNISGLNPGKHGFHIHEAGDLTDFSNRNKVKLIRQTKEGSHTVYLNINRSDFVSTEYYYIRPSDVLYIEPIKAKSWDVSANALGVVFSAVSLGVLLTNIFLGR